MKKILTMAFITFFLITGIFMLIGCNQKKENYIFEVESKDEKNINVVLKDVKKGISKKAEVVISKAESISVKSNLISTAGIHIELYKEGSKDELITEEEIYSESNVTVEGIQEGKYDIYFTSLDDDLSGTIEVTIK